MFSFSSRTIVIIAAICFIGLVALQIAWIQSAYQGEAALFTKAKKQLEVELQSELGQNEQVKLGLRNLLDGYNSKKQLDEDQKAWFHFQLVQSIDLSPKKQQFGVYIDGISIARVEDDSTTTTVISNIFESPDSRQIARAGKLCIDCS